MELPSLSELNSGASKAVTVGTDSISDSVTSSASDAVASLSGAGLDAGSIAPEVLFGGIGVAALIAIGALIASNGSEDDAEAGTAKVKKDAVPRKNAVLVFGSTGKTGKQLVKELLAAGRTVIAACRSAKSARAAWSEIGVVEGPQDSGTGILFTESGVDITKPRTLSNALFAGATQVVMAVGPVRRPDGKPGFADNMSSERVDSEGVSAVAKKAAQVLPKAALVVEPIMQAEDFNAWEARDDTVMGGKSSSAVSAVEGGSIAKWAGTLVVEGGGFCGIASPKQPSDLSEYDGLVLRVRGNGETFKVNVKTTEQEDEPVSVYQASFDTAPGDWVTVQLPWHEFMPVNTANYAPELGPLDPSKVSSLGLVYSRFDINGTANAAYSPGDFSLELDGGFKAFKAPRPAIVLVSSANTERNALIGDDIAARAADVPIVQLNPGGTLNWKYAGEVAVRAAGLPYTVVRPTGLIQEFKPEDDEPYVLEFQQGDVLSGRLSREDVAAVTAAAVASPSAVGLTFEARRSARRAVGGAAALDAATIAQEFLKMTPDRMRRKIGLPPLPAWVPPPKPVTEARKAEILADPRVNRASAANTEVESKVKAEAPAAAKTKASPAAKPAASSGASIALRRAAVQAWVASWRARSVAAAPTSEASPTANADAQAAVAANKASAQAWISAWKAKPAPVVQEEAAQSAPVDLAEIDARVKEAQAWIAAWRAVSAKAAETNGSSVGKMEMVDGDAKAEAQAWIAGWRAKSKTLVSAGAKR